MAERVDGEGQARPKLTARKAIFGIGLAWGPGIVIAVITGLMTKNVALGVLAFAITTAIAAIIFGTVGSVLLKRREERHRRAQQPTQPEGPAA